MTNQLFAVLAPILSAAGKRALQLFTIAALFFANAAVMRGQSALDGFNPNANGEIRLVVFQEEDGKILIAGGFTALAPNGVPPVTRNYLARLNHDGTLDTNFNPNPNSGILSLAVQLDGKILVGGTFANIGGQPRNRIARLDPVTGAADSFDPNANGEIYSIAVQGDGKILVGGAFTSIGGQTRTNMARLDPDTGLADSFNPNAQGIVQAITVQRFGKVLVGGNFATIGGQPRNFIAELDPDTGLADAFNPDANGLVRSIVVQVDNKIVVGGAFSFIGGQPRNFIARLDAGVGLADTFNPNANNQVYNIAIQPDGKILAGGFFSGANSIGGQARNFLARLDPATGQADSFDPNASGGVAFAVAVQLDGKVVAAGNFTSLSPNGGPVVTRNNIARLERDGLLDRTLNIDLLGFGIGAIALQPDGKILIGGLFTNVLGVARSNIARLNTDGTLDTAFNPGANGTVHSIVVQSDGQILVGGEFQGPNSIGGAERNCIARLNGVTGAADSFNPKIDSNSIPTIFSMALQGDDKVLICGTFTNIDGQGHRYLARLNPDGTLDTAFNPNPDSDVDTIALQYDGKILAGGEFANIGGQPRNNFARLDPVTGLADSFNPDADNTVSSIVVAFGKTFVGGSFTNIGGLKNSFLAVFNPNGAVIPDYPSTDNLVFSIAPQGDFSALVGGQFSQFGGQPRNFMGRLVFDVFESTNGVDSFDPHATNVVSSLALQSDGKILVAGQFYGTNSIGGETRAYFARLNNSIYARQEIQVDTEFLSWHEYRATPQFSRVTFEFSTNNANYTFLGNGSEGGGDWELLPPSGRYFNFPTGQNFYIRTRGYYSTGNLNGSESIQESVQIAYFLPPPSLYIQRDANTNVVLSWYKNSGLFRLETSTNLNANAWTDATFGLSVNGTNYVITNAISDPSRFYRLRE